MERKKTISYVKSLGDYTTKKLSCLSENMTVDNIELT